MFDVRKAKSGHTSVLIYCSELNFHDCITVGIMRRSLMNNNRSFVVKKYFFYEYAVDKCQLHGYFCTNIKHPMPVGRQKTEKACSLSPIRG
jgi:hypothetical protein